MWDEKLVSWHYLLQVEGITSSKLIRCFLLKLGCFLSNGIGIRVQTWRHQGVLFERAERTSENT